MHMQSVVSGQSHSEELEVLCCVSRDLRRTVSELVDGTCWGALEGVLGKPCLHFWG